MLVKNKETLNDNSENESDYDKRITKKIQEFDKRVIEIDKTVDDLFDLTEKMLLNIGEIK